jgi:hypothetical protein
MVHQIIDLHEVRGEHRLKLSASGAVCLLTKKGDGGQGASYLN